MNKLIILIIVGVIRSIYFRIEKDKQKCIHEELYGDTVGLNNIGS